jgi:preprotein translocase subunit YajC
MRSLGTIDQIKPGSRIVYNDGRPGHSGIFGDVLAVDAKGMTVQFEDRADRTRITFSDRAWMDFIELASED